MSLQNSSPTCRLVLLTAAGLGLAPCAPPAAATPAAMAEAIGALVGTAGVQRGKVKLELPPIVENGNTVPLTVSVDSPMSQADRVTSIHIFNQKNPQPYLAAFDLGSRAGKGEVSTCIRLADSQQVVAMTEIEIGAFLSGGRNPEHRALLRLIGSLVEGNPRPRGTSEVCSQRNVK
jgi:sulfur-oxidizing protein SoxY